LETPHSILTKYWKHTQFRPLQEDIIHAVMKGRDTLALLPTGGGKSVCFQVPAMLLEGLCIVITPLIALMKDQVEQLKKREIQAVAIHAGMSRQTIDILLDNCIYGPVKFLYVSPERLQTEIFVERVKQMKVSLIAVDEAHCISQWGYDFRPPYLKISSLRTLKPDAAVIALTATATELVKNDIIEKLQFKKNAAVFQKSFARENLSFVVRKTENKERELLKILSKVNGAAIIYVRSRKATLDIATWLVKKRIIASFYHAGLSFEDRTKRQDEWIQDKSRVMVATNAFGMGIDKSNVRSVIHLDLPENLEAYYQEAGRAGRDGQRAYAVILYQDADVSNLEMKLQQSQPSIDFLKQVYQCLANFYQLAIGSSEGESYDFDLNDFSEHFNYHPSEVYNALKRLEEEGLIQFNESYYSPSSLHISADNTRLYQFQVANARFDPLIKMILRLFGGESFSGFVKISEAYLAKAMKTSVAEIIKSLKHLDELKVVIYQPSKDIPQITFVLPRQDAERLPINKNRLEERRKLLTGKMKAMTAFVENSHRCRMQMIQDYFNEVTYQTCGICDVCIEKRKNDNLATFNGMRDEVTVLLAKESLSIEQLEAKIAPKDHELFVDIIREMVDEGIISYDKFWRLKKS
jgi:ATP-dependent DNA helicase RecQ